MFTIDPTDKSVGYFHFVRFADEGLADFLGKPREAAPSTLTVTLVPTPSGTPD